MSKLRSAREWERKQMPILRWGLAEAGNSACCKRGIGKIKDVPITAVQHIAARWIQMPDLRRVCRPGGEAGSGSHYTNIEGRTYRPAEPAHTVRELQSRETRQVQPEGNKLTPTFSFCIQHLNHKTNIRSRQSIRKNL